LWIDAQHNETRRSLECRAVVTQLPRAIQPPTGNRPVGGLRAGVRIASRNRLELESAGDRGRHGASRRAAIAELAKVVRAPAVGSPVGRERAGMRAADAQ